MNSVCILKNCAILLSTFRNTDIILLITKHNIAITGSFFLTRSHESDQSMTLWLLLRVVGGGECIYVWGGEVEIIYCQASSRCRE